MHQLIIKTFILFFLTHRETNLFLRLSAKPVVRFDFRLYPHDKTRLDDALFLEDALGFAQFAEIAVDPKVFY